MNRARELGRGRSMGLDDLEDEETVLFDEAGIHEIAFEVGIAFTNERRRDLLACYRAQPELFELVDVAAGGIADPNNFRRKVFGRDVDDAFPALADHVEAVVFAPDVAADEGGLKSHHHVPPHGHDVCLSGPRRADKDDRTRLQKPADLGHGKVLLFICSHGQ